MKFRIPSIVVAVSASLSAGMAHASCGSAFCVLSSDWTTQGLAREPGTARLDLRYEFVDQKHLRAGSKQISPADDTSDTTELRTINRNLLATFDYALTDNWTLSASAPVTSRSHSHISDPTGDATQESWNFTKPGDTRVLGYYRIDNPDPTLNYGLAAGLKLPTGDYQVRNTEGTLAERALQPGTGSTDLILGAFYSAPGWHEDSSWFAQGVVQQPIATKDGFKPGTQYQINLGYRYGINESLQALAQINTLIKGRDTGVNAETDLSGSRTVFFSPGLAYSLTHDVQLYGYVQLPLYRYVNGVQLSADWSVIVGVTSRF
jgi:Putative MetA-pathway of phenol degradation